MHEALETQTTKKIFHDLFLINICSVYIIIIVYGENYTYCVNIYHLHIVLILLLNDVLCYYGEHKCLGITVFTCR